MQRRIPIVFPIVIVVQALIVVLAIVLVRHFITVHGKPRTVGVPYDAQGLRFGTTDVPAGATAPLTNQYLQFNGTSIGGTTLSSPLLTPVNSLPPCTSGNVQQGADVTDCQVCTFGGTCTGGGTIYCPETCSPTGQWIALGAGGLGAQTNPAGAPGTLQFNNNGVFGAVGSPVSTTVTVSAPTTLVLPPAPLNPIQTLVIAATTNVTIPQGTFAGQSLALFVCQNSVGGFTPTLVPIAGLTIVGTFPTFTTTANACGDVGLLYTTATTAYVTGKNGGPL